MLFYEKQELKILKSEFYGLKPIKQWRYGKGEVAFALGSHRPGWDVGCGLPSDDLSVKLRLPRRCSPGDVWKAEVWDE